jgi:signal transduction histidine kinase
LIIQLIRDEEALSLTIEDDGIGFDFENAMQKTQKGVGLGSIKDRIENKLGGEIIWDSTPGEGTSVFINIPNIFMTKKSKNQNHV